MTEQGLAELLVEIMLVFEGALLLFTAIAFAEDIEAATRHARNRWRGWRDRKAEPEGLEKLIRDRQERLK